MLEINLNVGKSNPVILWGIKLSGKFNKKETGGGGAAYPFPAARIA